MITALQGQVMRFWFSNELTYTNGNRVSVNHNLSLSNPRRVIAEAMLLCKVSEQGWTVGDFAQVMPANNFTYDSISNGIQPLVTNNSISIHPGYVGFLLPNKNTGAGTNTKATPANWRIIFKIVY